MSLIKAGKSRNGKSGKNINKVGNKEREPMLIPAVNKVEADKPIKLSRENKENDFSSNGVFKVTEHKNSKKHKNPAKADNAVTGLGK